jgi:hypothetical protein
MDASRQMLRHTLATLAYRLPWPEETARFFASLRTFEDYPASGFPLRKSVEKPSQGPIVGALTRVGQLALLRCMAATPIHGENYLGAEIAAGHISQDQPPSRAEFD